MVVPIPFAFLAGAWGFGVAAKATKNRDLQIVSRYLAPTGVVAGLLAAVPGIVDYVRSVPPDSSAKDRATRHAVLNVASLALFSLGWLAERRRRRFLPIGLQSIGVTTLSIAGWMGGTLVHRNQIGIDHRYARAGAWKEETLSSPDMRRSTKPHTILISIK
jgi:uncharacterized membrane protein